MSENLVARAPALNANNQDLLVYALYSEGGFERWVDVEDLFLRAFQLAPHRLSWRTRSDLPDYKKLSKALQSVEDTQRTKHHGLVMQNGEHLRKLTNTGKKWCEQHLVHLESLYGFHQVPSPANQAPSRLVRYVIGTEAYKHFVSTGEVTRQRWQLAETLQCLVDSPSEVWNQRLDELQAAGEATANQNIIRFAVNIRAKNDYQHKENAND